MRINMQSRRRALLFLNAHSRNGNGNMANGVPRQLQSGGITLIESLSKRADDMSQEIVRRADEVDLVIVGGGDGTVNAALKGIVETGLPLGVLPLGTANDLARTLGIPINPEAAVAVIVAGCTRRIDVGTVNDQLFVNVASMGMSVELARRLTGNLKRRWGRLSYPLAALKTLLAMKPFAAEVVTKDRKIQLKSLQIAVGNGLYYGGGMSVYEVASIDDQCLDFYSVEPRQSWQWPLFLSAFRRGRHRNLRKMQAFCSPSPLYIRTDPPLPINTDGEITTTTPARFDLLPLALSVFVPTDRVEG